MPEALTLTSIVTLILTLASPLTLILTSSTG